MVLFTKKTDLIPWAQCLESDRRKAHARRLENHNCRQLSFTGLRPQIVHLLKRVKK